MKDTFGDGVQFNVNELQAGQGSGLGLHIAKGIVEQHGGMLSVTSEGLGRGATFTMALPLFYEPSSNHQDQRESSAAPFDEEHLSHETSESTARSVLRVLVVDDAALNRKLLTRWLETLGHVCDQAQNGLEAVKKVESSMSGGNELYDSVLLDFEMPRMNGPTAAKRIRELGSDVFIVGITGNLLQEDIDFFKSHGANCVLPKPVKMAVLEDTWLEYGILK